MAHPPLDDRVRKVLLQAAYSGHVKVLRKAMETPGVLLMEVPHGAGLEEDMSIDSSRFDFCDQEHYSPLMYACEKNHVEVVRLIVDCGADVWYTDKAKGGPGLNAVHIACIKGHLEVLELLLNIRLRDSTTVKKHVNTGTRKDGLTPMMYAVKNGHLEIVKYLLKTGFVDLKATSKKKQNALHIAAHWQQLECLKELHKELPSDDLYFTLDKKGWDILHRACAGGDLELLKWLFANVPKLNTKECLNAKTQNGYTPLLFACEYQKPEIVKLLLENEAVDPNACAADEAKDTTKTPGRKSGLHLAAIHDSPEIAQLLIDKGCQLDIQDAQGNTALHIARRKNSLDVIEIMRRDATNEVLALRNEDQHTQDEVQPEEVIPIEITKRGHRAVEVYRKALKSGKKKIPRCNLLILGEQEVGKTSLVRLLTGKDFIPDLDRTRGIDNTVVDTVDLRSIDTKHWEVVKPEDQARENNELFVSGVVEGLDTNQFKRKGLRAKQKPQVVSEQDLMNEIDQIVAERERLLHPPPPPEPQLFPSPPHHTPFIPRMTHPPELPSHHPSPPKPHMPAPTPTTVKQEEPKREVQPPQAEKPKPSDSIRQPTVPKKEEKPPRHSGRHGSISRGQATAIDRALKSGQKNKESTLHLNTYDFAGQEKYRPMHHCFITRRAMYLVVFNLQQLIGGSQTEQHSLEEIRYWLNSIHAHIHIPDEEDKKMKRVFLIGTHLSPKVPKHGKTITEEEQRKINARLKEVFYDEDEHVVNHLCFSSKNEIFIAVENSFDRDDEREKSGAKALQDELRKVSSELPFLKEVYPILWLRFESRIIKLREGTSLVVTVEKMEMVAKECGIDSTEEINAAMLFFHDTGTIVCLKELPTLYLETWEKKQLEGLVLLDPKWLINVMKELMELRPGDQEIIGKELRDLEKTGIAKGSLLKKCWEKECYGNGESFRQLCLMLQAYCLIYPIQSSKKAASAPPQPSLSDSMATSHASPPVSRSQSARDANISELFLVPCKLPEKQLEGDGLKRISPKYITFFFDFCGFLPTEIYHRLICLMLAKSKPRGRTEPEFSATCCRFYNVFGCRWKIKVCSRHTCRLEITVMRSGNSEPSFYVRLIHDEFLREICRHSGFQGLVYHGGPMLKECDTCEWKGVLSFVSYPEETEYSTEVECERCPTLYNVDRLLDPEYEATRKDQPITPPQTQVSLVPHGASTQPAGPGTVTVNVSANTAILPTGGGQVVTSQSGTTLHLLPQTSTESSIGSSPQFPHHGNQLPHPTDQQHITNQPLQRPLGATPLSPPQASAEGSPHHGNQLPPTDQQHITNQHLSATPLPRPQASVEGSPRHGDQLPHPSPQQHITNQHSLGTTLLPPPQASAEGSLGSSPQSPHHGDPRHSHQHHITNQKTLDLDQRPSLGELLKFQGRTGHINIPREIGRKYTKLSVFLLNDKTGSIAKSIARECMGDAEDINMEIMSRWLQGEGRQPVTWRTLVGALRDAELISLASDIECVSKY